MMLIKKSPTSRQQVFFATPDSLVPDDHLLKKIEDFMDWSFIYDLVGDLYSPDKGRPAVDPVILFKTLFIQFIYGIRSLRQTIEEIKVNNAYRWFLCLGPYENPPHYSTFSQNYNRKFKGKDIFRKIFDHILHLLMEEGLIDEETLFIDSTHIKACANPNRYNSAYVEKRAVEFEKQLEEEINRDRLAHGKRELKKKKETRITVGEIRQGLDELKEEAKTKDFSELEDFRDELNERKKKDPVLKEVLNWVTVSFDRKNKEHLNIKTPLIVIGKTIVDLFSLEDEFDLSNYSIKKTSISDPNSGWFHKGKHKHVFAYTTQTCCDKHGYILAYSLAPGNIHDSVSFFDLDLSQFDPKTLVLDAGYKTPKVVHSIFEQEIKPLLPYKRPMTKKGFFRTYDYAYDEFYDCYVCPNNRVLDYKTTNRNGYREYRSDPNDCVVCPYLYKCTESKDHVKVVSQHVWFAQMQLAEDIRYSIDMQGVYALRKETVERDFGDCKEKHGMRFTNYTGPERVEIQVALTYASFNLKKAVTHLLRKKGK